VHAPVVLNRPRISALLRHQVLVEEPVDRLVHRQIAVGSSRGGRVLVDFGDERGELPSGRRGCASVDSPIDPARLAIGVAARGHRELPHAGTNLDFRPAAPWRSLTAGASLGAGTAEREVVHADTCRLRGASQHTCLVRQWTVHQLPRDARGGDHLAGDLHDTGAVRLLGSGPEMMVAAAVDLLLEPVTKHRHLRLPSEVYRKVYHRGLPHPR
jgi:hypothetical protein